MLDWETGALLILREVDTRKQIFERIGIAFNDRGYIEKDLAKFCSRRIIEIV